MKFNIRTGPWWRRFLCRISLHDFMPWKTIARDRDYIYTRKRVCLYCTAEQLKKI